MDMDYNASSELILNKDHSVYHLGLLNDDIAEKIITVGDPERVDKFLKYFDSVEINKANREFRTITGYSNKERITVLSTGIGTDNIDIVFNELNILNKIDLRTKKTKLNPHKLKIVRIGTSGTIRKDIELGTYLFSEYAVGLEGLMHFYPYKKNTNELTLEEIIIPKIQNNFPFINPYVVESSNYLKNKFDDVCAKGITATCQGFYHPQARFVFGNDGMNSIIDSLINIDKPEARISNFEMETSGILGLSRYFNFEACSISLILANRINNKFMDNPDVEMNKMIDTLWPRILSM